MTDPKKVEVGKRLAELNCKEKEELAQEAEVKESEPKLIYAIGAVKALGLLGLLGYYIYQRGSLGDNNATKVTPVEVQTQKCANKFEME